LHVFFNADHTHSIEKAEEAALAGFDMVVFDASEKPIEEDITLTQRAVEAMKSINGAILVEGEVGYIGSGSELHDKRPENIPMTEPADARSFVAETRVDVLSPPGGTTHGIPSMVRGAEHQRLDIPRIAAIKDAVQVPLTLHGGSGTDAEGFRKAIKAGITMIHINTELRVAWRTGLAEAFKRNCDALAPYKLLPDVVRGVKTVVLRRLELFGDSAAAKR
jgi:fructose-bisphosphate aldolase class II